MEASVVSVRFKAKKSISKPALPKRHKREVMVRRVASMITDQATFDAAMQLYPPYTCGMRGFGSFSRT